MYLFRALESVGEKEVKDGEGEKKKKAQKPLPHFIFSYPPLSYYCTRNETVAWFCHSTIRF